MGRVRSQVGPPAAPRVSPGAPLREAVEGGRIGKVAIDLEASRSTSSTTVIDPSRPQTPISSRRAARPDALRR